MIDQIAQQHCERRLVIKPTGPVYNLRDNPRSDTPINRGIGIAIWLTRIGREISQRELARIMDVPRSYISKVELGMAVPSTFNLQCFAAALNVQLADLVALATVIAGGSQ
jgi:hypothetical protein